MLISITIEHPVHSTPASYNQTPMFSFNRITFDVKIVLVVKLCML